MARLAPIITLDELKTKLKKWFEDDDFPYNLPDKVGKDLAKVNFDWENYNMGDADPNYNPKYATDYNGLCGYPCGYKVLDNQLPVLFINAGGDWEYPICFCLYFDGKHIRGYIPTDGNAYNKKEKCAYGSEEDMENADFDNDKIDAEVDAEAIIQDVMNRIQIIKSKK